MSNDFTLDDQQNELSDKSVTLQSDLEVKWYYLSSAEICALTLTFLYYTLMICLGILCWLNAKRRYKNRQRNSNTWSRFQISPNQLHIKYTDDDGDSMAS
ncbi:unnamed protein product [Trichobilharzia regenti]|uniref:Uncharacterized protein n=1 Tax=Trichobilharzia regenti TaxID=157069 RepID=A0A183VMX6_TRIRE|nr:unnamed protein product [Trichobilharzia regenti]VDP97711.1 unnamed protein product [Trichobilharzia regenti]